MSASDYDDRTGLHLVYHTGREHFVLCAEGKAGELVELQSVLDITYPISASGVITPTSAMWSVSAERPKTFEETDYDVKRDFTINGETYTSGGIVNEFMQDTGGYVAVYTMDAEGAITVTIGRFGGITPGDMMAIEDGLQMVVYGNELGTVESDRDPSFTFPLRTIRAFHFLNLDPSILTGVHVYVPGSTRSGTAPTVAYVTTMQCRRMAKGGQPHPLVIDSGKNAPHLVSWNTSAHSNMEQLYMMYRSFAYMQYEAARSTDKLNMHGNGGMRPLAGMFVPMPICVDGLRATWSNGGRVSQYVEHRLVVATRERILGPSDGYYDTPVRFTPKFNDGVTVGPDPNTELARKNRELEEELEKERNRNNALRDEIEQLNGKLEEKDNEIKMLKGKLEEKDNEIKMLKGKLEEKDNKIDRLKRELGEKDKEIDQLKGELEKKNKKITRLEDTANKFLEEVKKANPTLTTPEPKPKPKRDDDAQSLIDTAKAAEDDPKKAMTVLATFNGAPIVLAGIMGSSMFERMVRYRGRDIAAPYRPSVSQTIRYMLYSNMESDTGTDGVAKVLEEISEFKVRSRKNPMARAFTTGRGGEETEAMLARKEKEQERLHERSVAVEGFEHKRGVYPEFVLEEGDNVYTMMKYSMGQNMKAWVTDIIQRTTGLKKPPAKSINYGVSLLYPEWNRATEDMGAVDFVAIHDLYGDPELVFESQETYRNSMKKMAKEVDTAIKAYATWMKS